MEIKTATAKLNNETGLKLHSQAEKPQMAPGSQRKSIQEDVLIYIADVAERLAWGEHGSRHTKKGRWRIRSELRAA